MIAQNLSPLRCTVALLAVMLMLATGTSRSTAAAAAPPAQELRIDNFTFTPNHLTVAVGTAVRWVNHDDIPHTVVSTTGVFKSKALDSDESFAFTFTKAGSYPYFCSLHPKMTGTIIVQ
jgi:plastocyanin